jgi:hypothetical protein
MRRLPQFPCERVFAAAAANDKDFHSEARSIIAGSVL